MEDFMAKKSNLDSPISRVRNASQEVEKDVKTIRGEKRVVKVSQSIKLESANVKFTERGEQYLYSSDSNDYLLKFHKNGKLIASFYEKNGKTYLHFGEEFFKAIDKEEKYAKYHGKDVEISKNCQGTSHGISAVKADAAGNVIGLGSSAVKEADEAQISHFAIALDALAVIVHPDNELQHVGIAQLFGIYTGAITKFSALSAA